MRFSPMMAMFCGVAVTPGAATATAGQAPPAVDIFLATLETGAGGVVPGAALRNVTGRDGYDNQPQFSPDGRRLLYTSIRDGQADIYQFDIGTGETSPVTQTAESEYSATFMPGGRRISVIRVEADSTQRLWSFDLRGANPDLVFEEIAPVGYHAWGDDDMAGLFVLGNPPTLQLADKRTGRTRVMERGIGRSIHRVPDRRAISFVHKFLDDDWRINVLDLATGGVEILTRTRPGAEDYAWTPDGTILMGQGSILYAWRAGAGWRAVADYAGQIDNITRLAVSPTGDRIALVAVARQ